MYSKGSYYSKQIAGIGRTCTKSKGAAFKSHRAHFNKDVMDTRNLAELVPGCGLELIEHSALSCLAESPMAVVAKPDQEI
jgi:hypothetical protein